MLALLSSLAIAASAPAAATKPAKAPPPATRPAPRTPKKVDACAPPEEGRLLGHQFTLPKCLEPRSAPKAGA